MIELERVCIRAGDFTLPDVSLRVDAGEYCVIMGKTGIGKTTILEAICGLRAVDSGQVFIDGVEVTKWTPADRNLGYVPQDIALFPTMNVQQHLEFAMRLRRVASEQRQRRSAEISGLLGIEHLLQRSVQGLSGGEAQRVALGRALTFRPSALLLDEPLSALDRETRDATLELLRKVNRSLGVAVIHVTHNRDEADALADKCVQLIQDPVTGKAVLQ